MIRCDDVRFSNSLISFPHFKIFAKLISERKFAKLVLYASLRTFEPMDMSVQHKIVFVTSLKIRHQFFS
jgi:hypothetical protein